MLHQSIGDCLRNTGIRYSDAKAICYLDTHYSWEQTDGIVDNYCYYLSRMNVRQGSRIAIWAVNSSDYIFALLALMRMGAIPVLISSACGENEIRNYLFQTRVQGLLFGLSARNDFFDQVVKKLTDKIPDLEFCLSFSSDLKRLPRLDLPSRPFAAPEIDPDETAVIVLTSGSCGQPKGVELSHNNLVNNSEAITHAMGWTQEDSMCLCVPLFHCFGLTASLLCALHCGCEIVALNRFHCRDVFQTINEYRCSVLSGVPTMFLAMSRYPGRRAYDLSSVRSGILAGSPFTPAEYAEIMSLFDGKICLQPSYGQTESSPCVSICALDDPIDIKAQTVGYPLPDTELKIVDPEGRERPTGTEGEIWTRGYHVMRGYFAQPDKTRETITKEGWLRTGDLGYIDDTKRLHVTGRIKDIIIRGGENISPQEIERAFKSLEEVDDCVVLSVPDPVLQEELCACVILRDGYSLDAVRMRQRLRRLLSAHKVPKYICEFSSFQLTGCGKVAKDVLRKEIRKNNKEDSL